MRFLNRVEAGKQLLPLLQHYANSPDTIVLGLPRGGVVTSFEVAKGLGLPMDIIVPRKISAPDNEEFAIGAITEDGKGVFDDAVISMHGISQEYIAQEVQKETQEAQRRLRVYRGDRAPRDLTGKRVILVDDGIATGATMQAAIMSVNAKGAKEIIVAVPVAAKDTLKRITKDVTTVHCLHSPSSFGAVGQFYKTFDQTKDKEVVALMKQSFENANSA